MDRHPFSSFRLFLYDPRWTKRPPFRAGFRALTFIFLPDIGADISIGSVSGRHLRPVGRCHRRKFVYRVIGRLVRFGIGKRKLGPKRRQLRFDAEQASLRHFDHGTGIDEFVTSAENSR